VIEKATGATLGEIGIASAEDISAAAATARKAQKEWAKVARPKRGDVLREFSRLLLARSVSAHPVTTPFANGFGRRANLNRNAWKCRPRVNLTSSCQRGTPY
jgi:hypothetical protein